MDYKRFWGAFFVLFFLFFSSCTHTLPDRSPLLTETIEIKTPQREQFREMVIQELLEANHPIKQDSPHLFLIAGGSSSGKSSLAGILQKEKILPPSNIVVVNPDSIKKRLPEYQQVKGLGDHRASFIVHEESSLMAKKLFKRAIEGRYNVILDVTLGNPKKAFRHFLDAKRAGYQIHLFATTTSVKEAIRRSFLRGKKNGRYVPTKVIKKIHQGFSLGFESYAVLADTLALYDTSKTSPHEIPHLVAQKKREGSLDVLNQKRYEDFMNKRFKGGVNHMSSSSPWTLENYLHKVENNLLKTSRTMKGVLDISASKNKGRSLNLNLKKEELAKRVHQNIIDAATKLYHTPLPYSVAELKKVINETAKTVNQGIVKEDHLLREHDSPNYPYTKVKQLKINQEDFFQKFFSKLRQKEDPIEIASWVEYRINLTDHFYSDGCGKISKLLSSWVLLRFNQPLPNYPEGKEIFAYAPNWPTGTDKEMDFAALKLWQNYYQTFFKRNST